MSQKINPISFRLGLFQVWNDTIPTYNKKSNFNLLNQKNNFENYLRFLFSKIGVYSGNLVMVLNSNKILIIITYVDSKDSFLQSSSIVHHLNNVVRKIFQVSSFIYLIKHASWVNSSELVKSYLLFENNKSLPIKNILRNTSKVIFSQLGTKKSVYTSKGPLLLKLSGFRFKLSGRFDNSRNQMTKTIKYSDGSLPMPSINTYSEYSHTHVYTKSGVCGLGIWLTYTT